MTPADREEAAARLQSERDEAIKHAEALADILDQFVSFAYENYSLGGNDDAETRERQGVLLAWIDRYLTTFNQWKEQRAKHTPDSPQNAVESENTPDRQPRSD